MAIPTAPEHEHSAAIDLAADWLAQTPRDRINRPIVPLIRNTFGLSLADAMAAITEAQRIRKGGADANP